MTAAELVLAHPQPVGAFGFPAGLLLIGPGSAAAEQARQDLVDGRLPVPWPDELAGHALVHADDLEAALTVFGEPGGPTRSDATTAGSSTRPPTTPPRSAPHSPPTSLRWSMSSPTRSGSPTSRSATPPVSPARSRPSPSPSGPRSPSRRAAHVVLLTCWRQVGTPRPRQERLRWPRYCAAMPEPCCASTATRVGLATCSARRPPHWPEPTSRRSAPSSCTRAAASPRKRLPADPVMPALCSRMRCRTTTKASSW